VDDTLAIQVAITLAKSIKKPIFISVGKFLISATLEVSGIEIYGNDKFNCIIQATAAQFNLFTTIGNTRFRNFTIQGGWDGTTVGQLGNSILLDHTSTADIFISDLNINYSKENAIRLNRAGYSSISSVTSRVSGLNGIYIYGLNGNDASTTVDVSNSCTFSDCPNGYGVKIENGINISLNSVISEFTKGFGIFGSDNRNINITNCYQENTSGNKFIAWNGAGLYMNIFGCFGGGHTLDYNPNYFGVNFLGNVQLYLSSTSCYNWNMLQDGLSSLVTTGHKQILGLNTTNQSGGTPAHILDTSPISGFDKSILELRNSGNVKLKIDSEGGLNMPISAFNVGHITLGTNHIWVDATGKLRIKNGQPTNDTDGAVVGSQS
jgi:hypothetical protein